MRKVAVLLSVLLLLSMVAVAPVSADVSSDDITVTVTGNGTWADGVLSVSLFPGQEKVFTVTVNSVAAEDILITPVADPGCTVGGCLAVCFVPTSATLVAGGSSAFNLTVTAKGNAPPGVFSSNLTIEADIAPIEPPVSDGVPDHMTLTSAQSGQEVEDSYDLTATVYDSANAAVPGVSVSWSVLSGVAALSSLSLVTNADGQAHAVADSNTVGTATIRCRAESYDGVLETIDLTWVEGGGNGDDVVTTPNIRQPISAVAFGEVLVDNALDQTVTIYNDGDAPLVVASIVRSSGGGDFTYISPLAPFTVGSSGSTVITIRFTPTAAGEASAVFTITSNDPDTPGVSLAVSGTGKSRGQPAWLVFLIGILVIGGGFGGYIYYKRWREKRGSLDILARGGVEDIGLGGDDELNLDT